MAAVILLASVLPVWGEGIQKRIEARQFIEQTYLDVLGRKATESDIEHYSEILYSGKSATFVRQEMIMSSECKEAITRIFQDVLDRDPTTRELNRARRLLNDGQTLTHIKLKVKKLK
jgi:hypothetical protein